MKKAAQMADQMVWTWAADLDNATAVQKADLKDACWVVQKEHLKAVQMAALTALHLVDLLVAL